MDAFNSNYLQNNGDELMRYQVKVQNDADNTLVPCRSGQTDKCKINYSKRYTPMLQDISPSNVYFDQEVTLYLNAMATNDAGVIKAGADPVDFIKFDKTRTDFEGLFDSGKRLDQYKIDELRTRVGDQKAGKSEPEVRFRTGNAFKRESSKHCDFAGTDCWYVKTHPKIDTISATEGFTSGGQEMKITGWGLQGTTLSDVQVMIDGQACAVTSSNMEEIKCKTGSAAGASLSGVSQPGSPGLTQRRKDKTPYWELRTDDTVAVSETRLLTAMENRADVHTDAGLVSNGWFKAPETGRFRFYISCDDACKLFLDSTNKFSKSSPVTPVLVEIANRNAPTEILNKNAIGGWRDYLLPPPANSEHKWISDWVSLEKDEYYFIEGFAMETSGNDHFTTSVEFEKAVASPHHHARKEIQVLTVDTANIPEQFQITVDGETGEGDFKIQFLNPRYNSTGAWVVEWWVSDSLKDNVSASEMKDKIKAFFTRDWGSNIDVTKVDYDKDAQVTVDPSLVVKSVFTVSIRRRLAQPSYTNAAILPNEVKSTVTISTQTQQSSEPISGNFIIACTDDQAIDFKTTEMSYDTSVEGIDVNMQIQIPQAQFKTLLRDNGQFEYRENGIGFAIIFQDLHAAAPKCRIESGNSKLLAGANKVIKSETVWDYGKNLMFEPIPLEFIYTDAQKPQVLVSVNSIDAVCPAMNCDYVYIDVVGEISSQTLSGNSLTIVGTDLPTSDVTVKFATSTCTSITATSTQITCTLDISAAAGSWDVVVTGTNGLIPLASGVAKISVAISITSITPATELNQMGGDILTIVGTGFDHVKENNQIAFSDGTACDILTNTPTQITCMVFGFNDATINPSSPYTVSMTINTIVDSTQTVQIRATKQKGKKVTPNFVSPILPQQMVLTLDPKFSERMYFADFTVTMVSATDASFSREIHIYKVSNSAKTLDIKYPGAPSGDYYFQVNQATIGRIDKFPLALKVGAKITAVTPVTGSYCGGTVLTIDGENFSDVALDNPVKIGNNYCLVETTSVTQITCRIAPTTAKAASQVDVVVILRVTEEASSNTPMLFDYAEPLQTMTALQVLYHQPTVSQLFIVTGTGFIQGDLDSVSLYIDGKKQETQTISTVRIQFRIIDVLDYKSDNVRLYFADGLPKGYENFQSMTMTPQILSMAPSTGSSGGSTILVTGSGFGPNTKNVNLIQDSTGIEICKAVTITGYGAFRCLTKAMEISSTDVIKLKTAKGKISCDTRSFGAQCSFEQKDASSPTITAISKSSDKNVVITGTDFPTSGKKAVLTILGLDSDSATINSDLSVTAVFDNGVPVTTSPVTPLLKFVEASHSGPVIDSTDQLIANAGSVTLDNAVVVTASSSGTSCSFQGGCSYEVSAKGLKSSILADSATNYLDVCGQPCAFNEGSSTLSKIVCTLPYLSTTYSATTYSIVQSGVQHDGTWTGTATEKELKKLTDNKNMVDLEDTSASCHFQIQYKENYIGVLDEVKFFVNDLVDKTPFVGNLKLQGSNDGSTFTDLWTIDASVHEGWNTKDWDSGKPSYNIYRFQGSQVGSCRIGEVRLLGIASINSSATSYSCTPKLMIQGVDTTATLNPITFDATLTPVLTSMSKRYGSVLGGTTVEFIGTGFSASAGTTVMIDDRSCTVSAKTTVKITCTTKDKPYREDVPTLVITIAGKGYVATKGQVFRYVSLWSDTQTWGGDLPPIEGEAVNIPKGLHLLIDVDISPKLSFVTVEGSLIFAPETDPNHVRTFDTHYILVRGGYMEVGTEEHRYTSKLTITMHSTKYDPNLPIFGNKVIGVNYGTLEMHGNERTITWTELKSTVAIGGTSITLNDMQNGDVLDWQVGEDIVIASSDFSGRNAEQRTIASITDTNTNPVITFTEPLLYQHYAGVQTYGSDSIEMRAEVGLLTRNVKFQGDETSADEQYGAVIIVHSPGDETSTARIDGVELYNVGQAFILGSYPIHFHMIGTVHNSYIRNNAIHHTFNRAVTIHGIHYLRVQNNVAYHTMGHTIFIEDAAETKNLIEKNLIVDVRRSWSLLNTDQTPASIWITNPDNIIRGNHAAGSDRYSYWYDTQKTAIGPSFDANICPENTKLGEFRDNVAHSNGRYGLRIFHNLIPREHPCEPFVYSGNPADPYPNNAPIVAEFHNLVSWKNRRNGAIAERVGAVQFHNFKTADNILAGMEFSLTEDIIDGYAKIVGGMVIGRTENTEAALDVASPHGIITPRTENFSIEGTKFYNYNWEAAAGLGTCSHCFHPSSTDSGARTVRVSNLEFDEATVTKRIRYQYPERAIFYDETGGLTKKGPKTWAVPNMKHLQQPECEVDDALMGGITCNSSVEVRRIAFYGYTPDHFLGLGMKIAQLETADEQSMQASKTLQAYLDDEANYSEISFTRKLKPLNAWAVPYVTNHRYRVHWHRGLDFNLMNFERSERWETTDLNTFFQLNFTETREAVNFTSNGEQILNKTMEKSPELLENGDNLVLNATDQRLIEFVVNGKNADKSLVQMQGVQCLTGQCDLELVNGVPIESKSRFWSDVTNWAGNKLPEKDEYVIIQAGWNMILDVPETPVLQALEVNGRLTFVNQGGQDLHLKAKQIFVRAGEILIGNETHPFEANALITLHGKQDDVTLTLAGSVSTGNKVMANVGNIKFYGKKRDLMTRLTNPVAPGATEILVAPGLDWKQGDEIYIAPSTLQYDHSDYRKIADYNAMGGIIKLDAPLDFYHWGQYQSTANDYNGVDMRTEVVLLSRNVKIQGEDVDGWGGQVLTTDMFEIDGTWRKGVTIFDNVQVYNCSQQDTFKSALRWDLAQAGHSIIQNSVVHGSMGWHVSINRSNNVILKDSFFIGGSQLGVHFDFVRNITMTGTMTADIVPRSFGSLGMTDKEACVALCSFFTDGSPCIDITVTNNIAAGCKFAGFIAPGHDCDDSSSTKFRDNVSHSNLGVGAAIYPDKNLGRQHGKCYEMSHFKGYKTTLPCLATHYPTREMRAHHITCIDSQKGINMQTAGDGDDIVIKLYDSHIYGETQALDCPDVKSCYCPEKMGLMLFGNNMGEKDLHIPKKSARPIYKIKSYSAFGGKAEITNVRFINFNTRGKTKCQNRQTIFARNPYSSDKIPVHKFMNCKFTNVDDESMAFFSDPDPGWAIIKDCGAFPCTAPNNILMTFENTSFNKQTPSSTQRTFQIIPDDPSIGGKVGSSIKNCQLKQAWNGYYCQERSLSYIVFESLDDDRMDRTVSPISILNEETGFNNTLNSMMDHVWDGFYTGQRRASRFPAILTSGADYTFDFSGTPPQRMRFKLQSEMKGIKIKIPYPIGGSVKVFKDGRPQEYTRWSTEIGAPGPLKNNACGENRFVGVDNYLEFYITSKCEIRIEPRDAIMTKVRLEWTLKDFYAQGGVTRFIDRMAAALGVPSYRVKTVAVYEGSVIIDFIVESDENETLEEQTRSLEILKRKMAQKAEDGTLDVGAPIIGLQDANGELLAGDPIPTKANKYTPQEDASAIIRNGPNLWDEIVIEQIEEQKAAEEEAIRQGNELQAQAEAERDEQERKDAEYADFAERLFQQSQKEEAAKLLAEIEAGKLPETKVLQVKVTVPVVVDSEKVDEEPEDAQKYLIIIPALVVGVLVILAVAIAFRVWRSRKPQQIKIKRRVGNIHDPNNVDAEFHDVQYVMDDTEKNSIFARTSTVQITPGRIRRRKGLGRQDDSVQQPPVTLRTQGVEDDDSSLNQGSVNSSQKFSLQQSKSSGTNVEISVQSQQQWRTRQNADQF